jgi:hypothetical protein
MFTEMELFECPDPITLDFCLCGWKNSEVYRRKVAVAGGLLARNVDVVACIKKREDQLTGTTRDFRTRDAKCTEVDCEIFRTFIVNRLVCIVVSCLVCIVVSCLVCIVVSCLVCTVVILCVFVVLCVYC